MKKTLLGLLAALALAGAPLTHAADAPAAPAAPAAEAKSPSAAKAIEKLDINSATAAELAQLKGIGPARAQAIIDGRPYKGKDELQRRKLIPQSVYDQIKDDIIARQK